MLLDILVKLFREFVSKVRIEFCCPHSYADFVEVI